MVNGYGIFLKLEMKRKMQGKAIRINKFQQKKNKFTAAGWGFQSVELAICHD